jgi:hypothetical protein
MTSIAFFLARALKWRIAAGAPSLCKRARTRSSTRVFDSFACLGALPLPKRIDRVNQRPRQPECHERSAQTRETDGARQQRRPKTVGASPIQYSTIRQRTALAAEALPFPGLRWDDQPCPSLFVPRAGGDLMPLPLHDHIGLPCPGPPFRSGSKESLSRKDVGSSRARPADYRPTIAVEWRAVAA